MKTSFWMFIAILIAIAGIIPAIASAKEPLLILYLPFDEGSGTVAKDLSGNGHDGEIHDAAWTQGKYDSALEFDGNSYVEVPHSSALNPKGDFSYMAWIKSDNYQNGMGIISKYIGSGNQRSYDMVVPDVGHASATSIGIDMSKDGAFSQGATAIEVIATDVLEKGTWQHIAAVFESEKAVTVYVDGKVATTEEQQIIKDVFENPAVPLRIAVDFDLAVAKRYFIGTIDEVVMYDKALTQNEMLKIMEGDLRAVEPKEKLAVLWGKLKMH